MLSTMLADAAYGDIGRLVVSMPPRHGKSELCSLWYPVWYLTMFPHRRIILTSYEADFAAEWGRKVRNSINENSAELGVQIAADSNAANRWHTSEGGGMKTAGAGGPITGRGGDLVIIDDPIKNFEEAFSETMREKVWNWYTSTVRTRLEPGGCIVIVMTRWHEDDLIGRLKAQSKASSLTLHELVLPAIAEDDDDALGRKKGEALWPERYDEKTLGKTEVEVQSIVWAGLYQQRPAPVEGSIIKREWLRFWSQMPKRFDEVIQSWDLNFDGDSGGSYVVGQVWGRLGADVYLLHQYRAQVDFPATIVAFETVTLVWPSARRKLVEKKANGAALISSLKSKIPGIVAVIPNGSKEVRVLAVSAVFESGNVYLPDPKVYPWAAAFVSELLTFPRAKNDDQVDACTQALDRLCNSALERLRKLATM